MFYRRFILPEGWKMTFTNNDSSQWVRVLRVVFIYAVPRKDNFFSRITNYVIGASRTT